MRRLVYWTLPVLRVVISLAANVLAARRAKYFPRVFILGRVKVRGQRVIAEAVAVRGDIPCISPAKFCPAVADRQRIALGPLQN